MKHKVSELEGVLLDAAVAKALGRLATDETGRNLSVEYGEPAVWWFACDEEGNETEEIGGWEPISSWGSPSSEWDMAGQIIERDWMIIGHNRLRYRSKRLVQGKEWFASAPDATEEGPTPLIAAMRAYVASWFGKEVEL